MTRSLEIEHNQPDVLNNLAWIRATHQDARHRNPEEAVRLALTACKLTGYKNPRILYALAVAYAATGNFPDAVKTAEKTLELARSAGQKELIIQAQKSLDLFKAGIPQHQGR